MMNTNSSSEEELILNESSSDDQPLSTFVLHKPKYRVGVMVRKKFGDKYFNGKIIRINRSNGQCHIKYCDGDSESMSEEEIEQHIMTI